MKERDRESEKHRVQEHEERFKALLVDMVKQADTTWHDARRQLRKEDRYSECDLLDKEHKEKLFSEHIKSLEKKRRLAFFEVSDKHDKITIHMRWKEAKKIIIDEEDVFSKVASNGERDMATQFAICTSVRNNSLWFLCAHCRRRVSCDKIKCGYLHKRKKFANQQKRLSDTDGKKEEDVGSTPDPGTKSGPIEPVKPPTDFKRSLLKFAARTMEKGTKALREDFIAQPRKQLDPEKTKNFHANNPKGKNRYKDVGCLDAHRVKLKDCENDYIHANYVRTPVAEKRFICTQAPVEATISDFWAMVMQEGCQNIIMLVSMAEKGARKWTEYFPMEKDEQIMFGEYAVSCMGQKSFEFKWAKTPTEICETALRVEHDGKSLKLKHYHWVDWPDRGVPPADSAVIELLQKICVTKTPIVVHCSAGVGRTGVVVMIQYVLEMVQLCQPFESLAPILKEIRSQRGNSVQTADQYFFVHMVLLQYWFNTELLDSKSGASHFAKYTEDYKKNTITEVPKDKK